MDKKKTYKLSVPRETPGDDYTEFYEKLAKIKKGDYVKLIFSSLSGWDVESMWVKVVAFRGDQFVGKLSNDPCDIKLKWGAKIKFRARHIKWIDTSEEIEARRKWSEEHKNDPVRKEENDAQS